jgi:hypothetical protein
MKAKVIVVATEHGTRYALAMNGRTVSPEFPFMSLAIMWGRERGLEVIE